MKRNQIEIDVSRVGTRGAAYASRLKREAASFLRVLKLNGVELAVALVRDRHIRALNAKWRKKDKATDVLSFPSTPTPGAPLRHLGDVIISLDTTQRQAKVWEQSVAGEMRHYLAHGLLHLLGYDHHRRSDAAKMAKWERKLLGRPGMLRRGR